MSTAGALIAAIFAGMVGFRVLRVETARDEARLDAERRGQASLVNGWLEAEPRYLRNIGTALPRRRRYPVDQQESQDPQDPERPADSQNAGEFTADEKGDEGTFTAAADTAPQPGEAASPRQRGRGRGRGRYDPDRDRLPGSDEHTWESRVIAMLRNSSAAPVYDVELTYFSRARPLGTDHVELLPPAGFESQRPAPKHVEQQMRDIVAASPERERFSLAMSFTDAAGVRWRRAPDGRLSLQ